MSVKLFTANQNNAVHRHGCKAVHSQTKQCGTPPWLCTTIGLKAVHRQRGQGGTPPLLMLQMPSELNVFNRTVSAKHDEALTCS